jgi:hypothetical protein
MKVHSWDEGWRFGVILSVGLFAYLYAKWVVAKIHFDSGTTSLTNRVVHSVLALAVVGVAGFAIVSFYAGELERKAHYRSADRAAMINERWILIRCFDTAPACQLTATELYRLEQLNVDLKDEEPINNKSARDIENDVR